MVVHGLEPILWPVLRRICGEDQAWLPGVSASRKLLGDTHPRGRRAAHRLLESLNLAAVCACFRWFKRFWDDLALRSVIDYHSGNPGHWYGIGTGKHGPKAETAMYSRMVFFSSLTWGCCSVLVILTFIAEQKSAIYTIEYPAVLGSKANTTQGTSLLGV